MARRWTILLMLWAAGCVGCAQPLPAEPEPAPQLVLWDRSWAYGGRPGQEVRTPHYTIFTTIEDPVFLERMPQFLENAFVHYQRLVSPTKKPTGSMEIYLFGRREEWERFTGELTGPSAPIYRKIQEGGYVFNGRAVFYDIRRIKTFAVTGHEGFHQYIWHYMRHRPPAWLDEGLACYFEGFSWQGNDLRFEPRRNLLRLRALRFALARKTLLDLPELLSTHPGIVIGGPSSKIASYYAQLWALVLFLQEDARYSSRFARMLGDIGTQQMIRQAARAGYTGRSADFGPAVFRAYIAADLTAAQQQFRAYCIKLADF